MRRFLASLLLLFALHAAAAEREHAVKAAFIFNILKFSQLPTSDLRARDQGLLLCVLNDAIMLRELREISGRPVRGGQLKVIAIDNLGELPLCDAVLVGQSWNSDLAALKAAAEAHRVLTLTEHAAAVRDGLMIGIVPAGSRLAIEINLPATRAAGIRLSAELLRLSRLLDAESGTPGEGPQP